MLSLFSKKLRIAKAFALSFEGVGSNGIVDLKTVPEGGNLLGYDFEKEEEILNKIKKVEQINEFGNWYLLNECLLVFENQSIFANGNVTHAKLLKKGDRLVGVGGKTIVLSTIKKIIGRNTFYKFDITGNHSFFVNGILMHNANRWWVGGTGTWDAVTTTHWAASSGGAGGASVPSSVDSVILDNLAGGGTITVNTNFTIGVLTFSSYGGTLDFSVNNNSPTLTGFTRSIGGIETWKMGSGTFTLTGNNSSTNPWDINTTTNLTFQAGTSTLKMTSAAAQPVVFRGAGLTYNNVWFARGASTQVNAITGSSTFNDFKDDGSAAHSLRFATGTTQTVTTFSVSGNPGALITLTTGTQVATGTTTHTLSKASGTVTCQYLDISHSVATGGATWNAGTGCVNNNSIATAGSGWIFPVGGVIQMMTDILRKTSRRFIAI